MQFPSASGFGSFDTVFTIVSVVIAIGFITVFTLIFYNLIRNAKVMKKNNNAPVLTTDATVVAKRADVIHRRYSHNDMGYTTSSTTRYYVTFQVPSGDRMELQTQDFEYGLLVENDMGKLTFQGTHFLKFERNKA
jgi:hypothetical protein